MGKLRDTILGVITGDCFGAPVQFVDRSKVKMNPVTEMRPQLWFDKPAGSWTDDGSLTLCLLDSLATTRKLDFEDVMNRFVMWLYENYYTPACRAYDIGYTCQCAIANYKNEGDWTICGLTGKENNGNGSLMRISPIFFYLLKTYGPEAMKNPESFKVIHQVSALTHAHPRSLLGCDIYLAVMFEIWNGTAKEKILGEALKKVRAFAETDKTIAEELCHYQRLFMYDFADLPENEISSSGYVVHTLEAALWAFLGTDSYRECLVKAVNLGDDSDTVGAVAGGLAGLFYSGEKDKSIPDEWLEKLMCRDFLDGIIEKAECVYEYNCVWGRLVCTIKKILI